MDLNNLLCLHANITNLDQDLDQNSCVNGALDSLYITHIFFARCFDFIPWIKTFFL